MEITLLDLAEKRKATIKRLGGGHAFRRRLASLNLRPGKIIRKMAQQPLRGPVVVEIGNTRISLGRGMAMRIFVEAEK